MLPCFHHNGELIAPQMKQKERLRSLTAVKVWNRQYEGEEYHSSVRFVLMDI